MSQEKAVHRVNISEKEKVRYVDYRVNIPDEQRERFCEAIDNKRAVSIRFRHQDLSGGDDLIAFTMQQFKRIASAFDKGRGVIINMSEEQVQKHEIIDEDDYFYSPF